jgi:hypothetical protein
MPILGQPERYTRWIPLSPDVHSHRKIGASHTGECRIQLCGGSVGGVDEYEMDGRELLLDIMAATCLVPGKHQPIDNIIYM